jgi:FkbM family methyltransferase
MRASVVIATSNRSAGIRDVLDAMRRQTHTDFEVVVVKGPCEDDTDAVLAQRSSWVRVVENPVLNLSKSRNLGLDAAAGEIVAFIDDDAVPEPRWLEELTAAYTAPEVGGAGGFVYDVTGVNLQYRYAVCDRIGRPDFDRRPPLDALARRHADPCLYLQGTNMSFRREVLATVGGFDENIEYVYDDVDMAMQVIDGGWQIRALEGAYVHHKVLPSALRRQNAEVTDPYVPVKNRTYFALRMGTNHRGVEEIVRSLTEYLDLLTAHAANAVKTGRFTDSEAAHFVQRAGAGFQDGFAQGMRAGRAGRAIASPDPHAFVPFPVLRAEGRSRICLVSVDYPPKPMGGIARYTVDWARAIAEKGHDVHVVTQADPPYRVSLEDGVWVHRFPNSERLMPALEGHPLKNNLAHVAAVWHAVSGASARFGLDLVAGNVWLAEVLACALDPRWPTVMTLSTPVRTIAATQPAVAAKPEAAWQIKLEDIALGYADQLHPLTRANLEHVRDHAAPATSVPAEVIWLGLADRATGPRQAAHDGVEILFVGRLEPRKGIDTLIAAATRVLRDRPEVRLRVAGAENPYASEDPRPYAERVRELLASEPDVLSRIQFEGEVDEATLDGLFQSCDIFCAPSRYESFGLMNVEAMMFSRPVVSCRVGGIEEVVVDGETGILVEPDDAEQLQQALRRLVDEPGLRDRMGAAGRRRYEAEFTSEVAVQRILDLFARTIRQSQSDSIGPADAASVVTSGLAEIIRELGGVADAEAAARELLEPTAFPQDYMATVTRLENASERDFVTGLYRLFLVRDPDEAGLEMRATQLQYGARSRADIVRELATCSEAQLRGVDTRFLARLPSRPPPEVVRRVREAFWRDDSQFAAIVVDTLLGPIAAREVEIDAILARLRAGASRTEVLRELVDQDAVSERLHDAAALADQEFLTRDELREDLGSLARASDRAFVAGVYRLLLGREVEPQGEAGALTRLRQVSRRQLVAEVAGSAEATSRGVDPYVVASVADGIGSLQSSGRAAMLARRVLAGPSGRKARQLARRVLRDPRVAELREQVAVLEQSVKEQSAQLRARDAERRHEAEAVERISTQLGGLSAYVRGDGRERLAQQVRAGVVEDLTQGLSGPGTWGTYIGNGRMLIRLVWGGQLVSPADDLSLTPELVAHGIYEAPFTRYLQRTLRAGHRVVDVGANIGMHTVLMAAWVGPAGRVLAYEPNPEVLGFLRENVALNWLNDRVTIRPAGASENRGRTKFFITERFKGNSSLLEPGDAYFVHAPMDTVREIEIEVEPVDAAARELGHIDLVKIDVEGSEDGVLAGMSGLFEDALVDRVTFEVYRERMGDRWLDFSTRLRGHARQGWCFHEIRGDGTLEEIDLEQILSVGRYSQVVMCQPQFRGEPAGPARLRM